jgi:hypothetical protein
MAEQTNDILTRAYELIESDKLPEAEALLKPILEKETFNADAWWLYAHAVSDPEVARSALNQVLKLDPDYDGAENLLASLDFIDIQPASPATLPQLPDEIDLEADDVSEIIAPIGLKSLSQESVLPETEPALNEDKPSKRGGRSFPMAVVLLAILVLLIIAIVLVNPFGNAPADLTPTDTVGQLSGPVISSNVLPSVTALDPTVENSIATALANLSVVSNSIGVRTTDLGNTAFAGICTSNGEAMRNALREGMNALATAAEGVETDAVGIMLVDCEAEVFLRAIAVPTETAKAFSAGLINEAEYSGQWVAVN